MKISDLELYCVEVERTVPLPPVRSLLVRLGTDEGREGWGEMAAIWRPGELAARRDRLLPVLAGRSVFDVEELQTLDALDNSPLRSAVEMACWDLIGQVAGQPICRLLGGEYRRRIPLAVRLSGRWPERMARAAHELADQGFHAQIVTVTGDMDLDRQILLAIRESVGERIALRVDAQASYTLEMVLDLCTEIEYEQFQFLLDPLATRELYPIAALGRQTSVPLAIWRAVRSPTDVLAAVRCGAAAYVVVDAEQVGGISPARACAAIGAAAGIATVLGSRPSLGIATAAMLHLAAATPPLSEANETSYHQLQDDLLVEPLEIVGGMMTVPQGPGLGIEVDRSKIERYVVT